MAKIFIGSEGYKISLGTQKIKLAYLGDQRVYSAGNIVTYYVDTATTYREEIDNGSSCLSPTSFVPQKAGWTFIGWREDTAASSSVLTSKVMGDAPITLYAVFRQAVTLTYYNGSVSPSTRTDYRLYNNGNVVNPTTALKQTNISGWVTRGWSTSTAANAEITYNNGATIIMSKNMILYGLYYRTVVLSLVTEIGTSKNSGTIFYNNSTNVLYPTFNPIVPNKPGWTIRGWSTGIEGDAKVTHVSGASITLTASLTLYALYHQTVAVYYYGYGNGSYTDLESFTRYKNSSGKLINPTCVIKSNNATKIGYTFVAWTDNKKEQYTTGTTITLTESLSLYAIWKRNTIVLFDKTNEFTEDIWLWSDSYRWYFSYNYTGIQTNNDACPLTTYTTIDCTDFKYCTIRIYVNNNNVDSSYETQNHWRLYSRIGNADQSSYKEIELAHITKGSQIGCYGEGVAYEKWADVTIDVSNLIGNQTIYCRQDAPLFGNSGYINVYMSKITMHN